MKADKSILSLCICLFLNINNYYTLEAYILQVLRNTLMCYLLRFTGSALCRFVKKVVMSFVLESLGNFHHTHRKRV